jgi:serine/threonine-protein kinase
MEHAITIGRYLLHRQIARGGMATIHIARLVGDEGFTRIVAAKRLHPEFAEDAEFVQMFLDEARVASKVHHRNVVPVLDVVHTGEEVVLVQEYVHGVPLHWLLRTAYEAKTHVPINVAVALGCQVLAGLQAAHETVDEIGTPLDIVHRDVSPQNVMVAIDGTARLLDFGVAKASMGAHVTRDGTFKGKLAYSAPEQIRGRATQQSDVYALSVVLWELLVGHRMHGSAQAEAELVGEILSGSLPTITDALAAEREWLGNNRWRQLETLEPIIQRGLATELDARWPSASEMEAALATAVTPASSTGVAAWLKALGKSFLEGRDRVIAEEESSWRRDAMSSAPRRSRIARAVTVPGFAAGASRAPLDTPDQRRDVSIAERQYGSVEGWDQRPAGSVARWNYSSIAAAFTPSPIVRRRRTLAVAACVAAGALGIGLAALAHDATTATTETATSTGVPGVAGFAAIRFSRLGPEAMAAPTNMPAPAAATASPLATAHDPAAVVAPELDLGVTSTDEAGEPATASLTLATATVPASASTPARLVTRTPPPTRPHIVHAVAAKPAAPAVPGPPANAVAPQAPVAPPPASISSSPVASAPSTAGTSARPAAPPNGGAVPSTQTPADDCNPPYYYEGTKKVFKTACL